MPRRSMLGAPVQPPSCQCPVRQYRLNLSLTMHWILRGNLSFQWTRCQCTNAAPRRLCPVNPTRPRTRRKRRLRRPMPTWECRTPPSWFNQCPRLLCRHSKPRRSGQHRTLYRPKGWALPPWTRGTMRSMRCHQVNPCLCWPCKP